ncbi:MAG: zinc ribbon domain-containing protein [Bacilli bacterium]|nr:zinc ribbon domain-containing protein [Bacilli bacterium]
MKCPKCGEKMDSGETFCTKCGTKVITNNNQFNNPNKKNYWFVPALLFIGFITCFIVSIIIGIIASPTGNNINPILNNISIIIYRLGMLLGLLLIPSLFIILYISNKNTPEEKEELNDYINNKNNNIEDRLLAAYIGKNYQKISQKKVSIPAFLLSVFYILYRKLYIQSLIILAIILASAFLSTYISIIIFFTISIISAIIFNKLYIKYSKKQIEKIKQQNSSASKEELIKKCQKNGGTNIIVMLIVYFIFSYLFVTIRMLTMGIIHY